VLVRDLGGLADLNEVMHCITSLAELAVQNALSLSTRVLTERYGQPIGEESGLPQELLVIAWANWAAGNSMHLPTLI